MYEQTLLDWIRAHDIACEHFTFEASTHSVAEAAVAVHATPEDFVKSICFVTQHGDIVVAIVKGEDRANRAAIQQHLGLKKLGTASPDVMLAKTGYPAGGTPPFGFVATFLMDERVFEREFVFAGGGSPHALIKINPKKLQQANGAKMGIFRN